MDRAHAIQFLNCVGAQLVPVHLAAVHLGVAGMQVEPVRPGQHRERLLKVRPQFGRRARFAGVIAGDGQPTAQRLAGILEAADIVALPAMDGNRYAAKLFKGFIGIHPQGGKTFPGEAIGLFDLFRDAHADSHG